MKGKTFFPFFLILIFLVALTLGCTGFGGSGGDLTSLTKTAKFSKGIFNSTIMVNGAERTEVGLISKQPAEVGLFMKNEGPTDITNMSIRAIGCVEFTSPENGIVDGGVFPKGSNSYFSWQIRAPELGTSESFTCPLIFRACFEEESEGYMELVVIPEDYFEIPSTPTFFYESGIFETEPNFGVFRVIEEEDVLYGNLKIKNVGEGWIDYLDYKPESELGIHKIRKITLNLEESSDLAFESIGGLRAIDLADGTVFSNSDRTLVLESGNTLFNNENYAYLLKLVGGQENDIRLGISADASDFTEGESYETIDYKIDSGYCIDLASINIKLSGR